MSVQLGATPAWQGATPAKKRKQLWKKYKIQEESSSTIEFECDNPMRPYSDRRKQPLRPFVWSEKWACKAYRHFEVARILGMYWEKTVVMENESFCMSAKDIRWIIDSGSGFDLISSSSLTDADKIEPIKNPLTMATANGITSVNKEWKGQISGIGDKITAAVLENSPCNVLSLGKLVMDRGYSFHWTQGKDPVLKDEKGKTVLLEVQRYVPVLPVSEHEPDENSGGRPPHQDNVRNHDRGGRPLPDDNKKKIHNITHTPYDPNCKICQASKGQKKPHRRVKGPVDNTDVPVEKFGDLITADHVDAGKEGLSGHRETTPLSSRIPTRR